VLYFEFDQAELHPRGLHQLDIIAGLLKSDPARKMRITGHTDALGTDDYNARLSAARAKNVNNRLIELGVAGAQIETIGFGSKAPLDPDKLADGTDNPEGRSRNRRTEIYLDF
jgi:outer membrane protein OmpA-like peptidoglycan-associated protein